MPPCDPVCLPVRGGEPHPTRSSFASRAASRFRRRRNIFLNALAPFFHSSRPNQKQNKNILQGPHGCATERQVAQPDKVPALTARGGRERAVQGGGAGPRRGRGQAQEERRREVSASSHIAPLLNFADPHKKEQLAWRQLDKEMWRRQFAFGCAAASRVKEKSALSLTRVISFVIRALRHAPRARPSPPFFPRREPAPPPPPPSRVVSKVL